MECPYCNSENLVWLIKEKKYCCNNCGAHIPEEWAEPKKEKSTDL